MHAGTCWWGLRLLRYPPPPGLFPHHPWLSTPGSVVGALPAGSAIAQVGRGIFVTPEMRSGSLFPKALSSHELSLSSK